VSLFEAIMLICFGVSWPVSIAKAVRTKVVAGGYISGLVHKALYHPDLIMVLYAVNLVLVAVDLSLYITYSSRQSARSPR